MDINKYIAGGLSGITEVLLTHPLDYIKTKKQEYAQNKINNNNFYRTLLKKPKLNMYNGILPRIYGIAPMRFIFWGVQDSVNSYLGHYNINKINKSIIIGCSTAFFQTIIDNPIEIIKIQQMSNQKINYKNILLNNYGFSATLIRNIFFAIPIGYFCFQTKKKSNSNFDNFCLSACSGLFSSIISQPFDYIKTYQQRTKSKVFVINLLIKELNNDPKKLYTGCMNRSLLNFFSMGIGYIAFDNFYKLINN